MRIEMNVTFGFEEMWHMLFLQDNFDVPNKSIRRYADIVSDEGLFATPSQDAAESKARMEQGLLWARQMDRRVFAAIQNGELCHLLARYEDMTDLRDFSKKRLGQTIDVDDLNTDQTVTLYNEQDVINECADDLRRIYDRGYEPSPQSDDEQERNDAALLDYLRLIRAKHQAGQPAFEEAAIRDMSPISTSYVYKIPFPVGSTAMDVSGREDTGNVEETDNVRDANSAEGIDFSGNPFLDE